jgi:hypothetical protein
MAEHVSATGAFVAIEHALFTAAWPNGEPYIHLAHVHRQRVAEHILAALPPAIDAEHLAHQREWSERTFGPGPRTLGVLDHIRKELQEIEDDPSDLHEWVDVVILALDGAWRAGWEPQQIIDAIKAKQARNEARTWPDWRTMSADQAIEHDRSGEPPRYGGPSAVHLPDCLDMMNVEHQAPDCRTRPSGDGRAR